MPEAIGLTIEEAENLSIPDLAALMQLAGSTASEQEIRTNVAAGAPLNADGTVSLGRYIAWLNKVRQNKS